MFRIGGHVGRLGSARLSPSSTARPRILSSRISQPRSAVNGVRYKSTNSAAAFAAHTVALIRRGASFGFYSAIVVGGIAIIGVTGYYLTQESLLPSSDGQSFHRAFGIIEKDEKSSEMSGTHLKAHGESTNQRNVKSRPIASGRMVDRFGVEHILMQFHVDGEKAKGVAKLEVVTNNNQMEFRYLFLDVPGYPRHYIINQAAKKPKRSGGLFGIRWGPRHHEKEKQE